MPSATSDPDAVPTSPQEDLVAFVRNALTTQSIGGCRCGMDSDGVRAVWGVPETSSRQGKKRVYTFESEKAVWLQGGRVVAVERQFKPSFHVEQLAQTLAELHAIEKVLEVGGEGHPAVRTLTVGRVSLEDVGDFVGSVYLSCE